MLIVSFFLFLLCTVPTLAQDWSQWRGPQRDGRGDTAIALPTSWPEQLQLQWEVAVGTGRTLWTRPPTATAKAPNLLP